MARRACGRGICALGTLPYVVAFNLFYGNAVAAILVGGSDLTGAQANDVAPGDGVYGNLDGDPLLADPDHGGFTLLAWSPAIDAGDPSLPHDPDGTAADLGPFDHAQNVSGTPAGPPELGARSAANLRLLPGAPNPFNPSTEIRFVLRHAAAVEALIVDARGRRVRSLFGGRAVAGLNRVRWDGRDEAGLGVASGVYVAIVRSGSKLQSTPLALVR
jgi:hypothetical protein